MERRVGEHKIYIQPWALSDWIRFDIFLSARISVTAGGYNDRGLLPLSMADFLIDIFVVVLVLLSSQS